MGKIGSIFAVISRVLSMSLTRSLSQLNKLWTLLRRPLTKITGTTREALAKFLAKPKDRTDYVAIGNRLVSKRLLFFIAIGILVSFYFLLSVGIPQMEKWKWWYVDLNIGSAKYQTFQGKARVYSNNKLVFEGDMSGGKMSGYGVQYDQAGNVVYKGHFEASKYTGEGEHYVNNNLVYIGNFENNLYQGQGEQYAANGTLIYSGSFEKGERSGSGIEYDETTGHKIYVGTFTLGKRDGSGQEFLNDGNTLIYEGEFGAGVYRGNGKHYENGLLKYEGEFSQGMYMGEGKLYDLETGNLYYSGEFESGLFDGQGNLYDAKRNVRIYEGSFVKGKRDGEGISYDILGTVNFSGKFKNDNINYVNYLGKNRDMLMESFGKPSYQAYYEDYESGHKYEYLTYSSLGLCMILKAETQTDTITREEVDVYLLERMIMGIDKSPYGVKYNSTREELEESFDTKSFASSKFTISELYKNAFAKLSLPLSGLDETVCMKFLPAENDKYFIRVFYSADGVRITALEVSST